MTVYHDPEAFGASLACAHDGRDAPVSGGTIAQSNADRLPDRPDQIRSQWVNMTSNLVVIGFDHAADACQMRAATARMQTEYLIEMEDAVVVTRDANGAVQLHQAVNLTKAGTECSKV